MKIVVFDDEPRIAQNSEKIIRSQAAAMNVENFEIETFSDVNLFKNRIERNKTDVAFLDISVPTDENFGISCAKQIRKNNKNAHIIFVTSNEGMIHQIFAGMIRPTQFILKNSDDGELASVVCDIFKEVNGDSLLKVTYGRTEYFLSKDEIVSIGKDGRKTSINLLERMIEISDSLASIYKKLGDEFVWADKGTIINKNMIKEIVYPEKKIIMINGGCIYMSRNSAKEIKKNLGNIG